MVNVEYDVYIASTQWRNFREQVLARDSKRCVLCNSDEALECHHRTYERFGKEELADCYTLCHECHEVVTDHQRRKRYTFQTVKYHLSGVCPLLMHNGLLADPLWHWTRALKKVSGKRSKTDADHEEMARLEWFGSLYLHEGKIVIPDFCLDATLINAAKKTKKGMQAKAAMMTTGHAYLDYDGPEKPEELFEDKRFLRRVLMKVKGNGVMRTQPHFFPWAATIALKFNDEMLNPEDIEAFVHTGGEQVGLLEGRPRFGRYVAQRV